MSFQDRFRQKKEQEEPRPQGELPPELLQALTSLPPQVAAHLMSVRSERELMDLLAEHPELWPVLGQIMQQAGGPAPSPTTPAQPSGGLQAELAQPPLEVQQIVSQLAQPVTDPRQQVQRLGLFERALALLDGRRLPQLWAALQHDFVKSI